MKQISVQQAAAWLTSDAPPQLVDCRERWEHELVALPGSYLAPLGEILEHAEELAPGRPVLVYCHHGIRSISGAVLLETRGFDTASMIGGLDAWSEQVDRALRRY